MIAEIQAATKKDEVVMLGGHLDSWRGSTGATDNAIEVRDDDGSRADSQGHRRSAAAHHSRRDVERRGAGTARVAGLCEAAFRAVRGSEARIRES